MIMGKQLAELEARLEKLIASYDALKVQYQGIQEDMREKAGVEDITRQAEISVAIYAKIQAVQASIIKVKEAIQEAEVAEASPQYKKAVAELAKKRESIQGIAEAFTVEVSELVGKFEVFDAMCKDYRKGVKAWGIGRGLQFGMDYGREYVLYHFLKDWLHQKRASGLPVQALKK